MTPIVGKWYKYRNNWLLVTKHRGYTSVDAHVWQADGDQPYWRPASGDMHAERITSGPHDRPPEDVLLSYMQWKIREATHG